MALKMWRNKKTDAKEVRAHDAYLSRPSVKRMSVYRNYRAKTSRDVVKGIDDNKVKLLKLLLGENLWF